jgi:hypothetical protein
MAAVHIHIHSEILQPGAGDPLALVQRAVERIADIERRRLLRSRPFSSTEAVPRRTLLLFAMQSRTALTVSFGKKRIMRHFC